MPEELTDAQRAEHAEQAEALADSLDTALDGLGLDLDAVDEGRWFPYRDGLEFRIVSNENDDFQEISTRLLRRHRSILRSSPDSKIAREIVRKATVKAVALKGIRGIRRNGREVDYDPHELEKKLLDPRMRGLYAWAAGIMGNPDNFGESDDEDDLGN